MRSYYRIMLGRGSKYANECHEKAFIGCDFDFNTEEFGADLRQTAQFWFEREYLTELSLVIEPGDIFDWNYTHFEVGTMNENQLVGGQVDSNWSVVCNSFLIRRSNLQIERQRGS